MSNDSSVEQNAMRNAVQILMQISFPYIIIISIIGICGNFLTIIMLSKKSLSKNFNNCTLIALALTDLSFNFTLVARSIDDVTQSHDERLCRLLSFLSHLAELLSACFTAQFTAQRFIAVRFPLSVFVEKKIHLVHYLIISIFITFGVIYCSALVHNTLYDKCHEEFDLKWFLSDALLSFLIPFTIIIILNILIVLQLKKGLRTSQQFRFINRQKQQQQQPKLSPRNFRKHNSAPEEDSSNSYCQSKNDRNKSITNYKDSLPQNQANDDSHSMNERAPSVYLLHRSSSAHRRSQSYRVTRMLILVSTCFLLLNAPSHICTIGLKIYSLEPTISVDDSREIPVQSSEDFKQQNQSHTNNNLKLMEVIYIIAVITQHISYVSYSINFFLYSFCGMKFRRELAQYMSTRHR